MVSQFYISQVWDLFLSDCLLLFSIWKSFLRLSKREMQAAIIFDALNNSSGHLWNGLSSFKSLCLGRWESLCLGQLQGPFVLWEILLRISCNFALSGGLDSAWMVLWHSFYTDWSRKGKVPCHLTHLWIPRTLAQCLAHRKTQETEVFLKEETLCLHPICSDRFFTTD